MDAPHAPHEAFEAVFDLVDRARYPPGLAAGEGTGAAALARAYAAAISAYWRGDDDGRFVAWLAGYRRASVAPPAGAPAAVSPHGAGGHGIAWHDAPGAVVGVVSGVTWGYRVPAGSRPPHEPQRRLAD